MEKGKDVKRVETKHTSSLCWDCGRAIGGCPWADAFRPVPGWVAEERYNSLGKAYIVISCPLFQRVSVEFGMRYLTPAEKMLVENGYEWNGKGWDMPCGTDMNGENTEDGTNGCRPEKDG